MYRRLIGGGVTNSMSPLPCSMSPFPFSPVCGEGYWALTVLYVPSSLGSRPELDAPGRELWALTVWGGAYWTYAGGNDFQRKKTSPARKSVQNSGGRHVRCQATSVHERQSWRDSGIDLQGKVLKTLEADPSCFEIGGVHGIHGLRGALQRYLARKNTPTPVGSP